MVYFIVVLLTLYILVEGENEEYLKFLEKKEAGEFDDYGDDDDLGIDGLDEDPYFSTVLDQLEPFSVFKDCLTITLAPEEFQEVLRGLASDKQEVLKMCFAEVDILQAIKLEVVSPKN
jgi:hypothetical protein